MRNAKREGAPGGTKNYYITEYRITEKGLGWNFWVFLRTWLNFMYYGVPIAIVIRCERFISFNRDAILLDSLKDWEKIFTEPKETGPVEVLLLLEGGPNSAPSPHFLPSTGWITALPPPTTFFYRSFDMKLKSLRPSFTQKYDPHFYTIFHSRNS